MFRFLRDAVQEGVADFYWTTRTNCLMAARGVALTLLTYGPFYGFIAYRRNDPLWALALPQFAGGALFVSCVIAAVVYDSWYYAQFRRPINQLNRPTSEQLGKKIEGE